jgi:hypothetical protein
VLAWGTPGLEDGTLKGLFTQLPLSSRAWLWVDVRTFTKVIVVAAVATVVRMAAVGKSAFLSFFLYRRRKYKREGR